MRHILKTWPTYFRDLKSGVKTFEIRKFDRDFKIGDTLFLEEYDPASDTYSGEGLEFSVTYLLSGDGVGSTSGIQKGFVILGISPK